MYRRNQVEMAIARSTRQTSGPDQMPMLSLLNDLKRLIDTDRFFPDPGEGATASERAFAFSEGAGPGKGSEVEYSVLDAFALLLAFNLSRAGLTQRRAVRKTRLLRPWLAREVSGRLGIITAEALAGLDAQDRERVIEGIDSPIRDAERRLHLALALDGRSDLVVSGESRLENLFMGVQSMPEVMDVLALSAAPVLVIDLGSAFVRLVYWLDRTEPAKRGRRK